MEVKITIEKENLCFSATKGETLLSAFQNAEFIFFAPCQGKHSCGMCKVKLLSGEVENGQKDENGYIRACKAVLKEDIVIESIERETQVLNEVEKTDKKSDKEFNAAIALDIGTTTISAYLADLNGGEIIQSLSVLNNQAIFGADVIARISAGKTEKLHNITIKNISEIVEKFRFKFPYAKINKMTVAGNTVMLHLFLNADPSSIGEYPFKPLFTDAKYLKGKSIGLDIDEIIVLPSHSAFLGADLIGGIASTNILKHNAALYFDIGTNGEIALVKDGKLFLCSAAAGPAFEGGGISCGCGAIGGAINSVKIQNGQIEYRTINGQTPVGICGSGLIDAAAIMLKNGVIDKSGAFSEDCGRFCERLTDKGFCVEKNIYITQNDIRQFQLALAAIKTAYTFLLKAAEIESEKIEKIYVAGGMGFFIDKKNAMFLNLIPKTEKEKIEVCGNLSLKGAYNALFDENFIALCEKLKLNAHNVDIALDPDFQELFIKNINF